MAPSLRSPQRWRDCSGGRSLAVLNDTLAGVRIDKWLWAARFLKTRGLAADAVAGGKVEVNGQKPKPAKTVRIGDQVRIRLGPFEHLVTVRGLAERRGPAAAAAKLYEEDPAGKARRETLAEQHRIAAQAFSHGEGKPSKKERRDIEKIRGKR
jgi:ribosome-associated heat shock protein Hsp15